MLKDKRKGREKQEKAEEVESHLVKYLKPVLSRLNEKMDRRLVKTFLGLVMSIIQHRHRNNGLLLSELGGYLLGSESCCAGTKRISNLLHSQKWNAEAIEKFQWEQASRRVESLQEQGERPLVIWERVFWKSQRVYRRRDCVQCVQAKLPV
jgi:hypothetical protein